MKWSTLYGINIVKPPKNLTLVALSHSSTIWTYPAISIQRHGPTPSAANLELFDLSDHSFTCLGYCQEKRIVGAWDFLQFTSFVEAINWLVMSIFVLNDKLSRMLWSDKIRDVVLIRTPDVTLSRKCCPLHTERGDLLLPFLMIQFLSWHTHSPTILLCLEGSP